MLYNKPRTQNAVLTLPYWELKLSFVILKEPFPFVTYLTLLGIETLRRSSVKSNCFHLTLPYWELKLFLKMLFSISILLTLPYWELKQWWWGLRGWLFCLTLPYWELKQQSHLCFGIKKIPLPYPIGDFITQKSSFSVGLKLLFCLMSREVSYIDESRIVSDEEKRYGRMYNRGRIIFSYYKWANF